MKLEDAINYASLWRAGKLIGGDAHQVAITLVKHIEALQKDAACWRNIRPKFSAVTYSDSLGDGYTSWWIPTHVLYGESPEIAAMSLDKP